MNWFAKFKERYQSDPTFRAGIKLALGVAAIGTGVYLIRRGGYKRGFDAGFSRAWEIATNPDELAFVQAEVAAALEEGRRP